MKGVVSDFLAGAHGEHLLTCGVERSPVVLAVRQTCCSLAIVADEMRRELVPHYRRGGGLFVRKARQPGSQGPGARRADFLTDRIIVMHCER